MTQQDQKPSRRAILRKAATVVGIAGASALTAACAPRAEAPPPPPAPPPAPPPPVPAPAPPPPPPPVVRQSKAAAHYQWHPHDGERCGLCIHFRPPRGCEIVTGRISPRGWCVHFAPRA